MSLKLSLSDSKCRHVHSWYCHSAEGLDDKILWAECNFRNLNVKNLPLHAGEPKFLARYDHITWCQKTKCLFQGSRYVMRCDNFLAFLLGIFFAEEDRITWWMLPADLAIHVHDLSGPVRDTPHIAQYPFEIVSQRYGGYRHPFALFSLGYRASIAEIPLLRGVIAPPLRMLSQGGNAQKRGRGYRTQLAMSRHQTKTP